MYICIRTFLEQSLVNKLLAVAKLASRAYSK